MGSPREDALPHSSLIQGGHRAPTRSVIARPILDSCEGRDCHHHGYPVHQGRVPHVARRYLIDEHPAGWSYLGGDFTKPAGFVERPGRFDDGRNQCDCHGNRHDPPTPLITQGRPPSSPTTATSSATSGSPCSSTAPAGAWSGAPRSPGQPSPTGTTSTTACAGKGSTRRCGTPSTRPARILDRKTYKEQQ